MHRNINQRPARDAENHLIDALSTDVRTGGLAADPSL